MTASFPTSTKNFVAIRPIAKQILSLSGIYDSITQELTAISNKLLDTASPTFAGLTIDKDQDAATSISIYNENATAAALSQIIIKAQTAKINFQNYNDSYAATTRYPTTGGINLAGMNEIVTTAGNGLVIGTGTLAKPIYFGTFNALRLTIGATGIINIGSGGVLQHNSTQIIDTSGNINTTKVITSIGNITSTGTIQGNFNIKASGILQHNGTQIIDTSGNINTTKVITSIGNITSTGTIQGNFNIKASGILQHNGTQIIDTSGNINTTKSITCGTITGTGNAFIGTGQLEVSNAGTNILIISRNTTESVGQMNDIYFATGSGVMGGTNVMGIIRTSITQATPSALKSQMEFLINRGDGVGTAALVISDAGVINIGSGGVLQHNTNQIIDSSGNINLASGLTITGSSTGVTITGTTSGGSANAGVKGINTNATNGYGVYGTAAGSVAIGVYGVSNGNSGYGVYATGFTGIYGLSTETSGIGVKGAQGPGDYGVYSDGDCHIAGTLSKTAGSFIIPHTLYPKEKVLRHSFVESPEMMNIYNGIIKLDNYGSAIINLPEYFDTLNVSIKYSLTPIGEAMPNLYISKEYMNNQFSISGGVPCGKVSWQITGVRNDDYARNNPIIVEENITEKTKFILKPIG